MEGQSQRIMGLHRLIETRGRGASAAQRQADNVNKLVALVHVDWVGLSMPGSVGLSVAGLPKGGFGVVQLSAAGT